LKPDTTTAMTILIKEIKEVFPFGMSEAEICAGKCIGCPKKLLEYISMQVEHCQAELDNGDTPTLADISNLARIGKKVHRSLAKNGLVEPL